jgi:hypothetical protein
MIKYLELVMVIIEDILRMFKNNSEDNLVLKLFNSYGMQGFLDALQCHSSETLSNKAIRIIEKFYINDTKE